MTAMKTLRTLPLFLFLIVYYGCGNQNGTQVHNVWNYLYERPDSALAKLNDYSLSDFNSNRSRAEFALLKSIALDKNYIDLTADSLIRSALDYYDKHGDVREKMLCWYYLGRIQANSGDYNDAIVSISRAADYSARTGDEYQKGLIHMAMENIYSNSHNHSEALLEAKLGVEQFEKIGEAAQAAKAKRKLALDYLSLRDFHHTDSLLFLLINNPCSDSSLVARCALEYARSLVLQERYDESLAFFSMGLDEYHGSLSIPQAGMYAIAQYHLGHPSIATEIKNQLAKVPSARNTYLSICLQESLLAGNSQQAMNYQKELMQWEDSIAVHAMEQSIIKSQRDYRQKSSEVFRFQSERRKLILLGVVTISLLLLILAALGVERLRKHHQKKIEKMVASQEEARNLLKELGEENVVLNNQLAIARRQYVIAYKKRFSKIAHLSETYYRTSGSTDSREMVYREVRDLSSFITKDTRTYKQLEKSVNTGLSDVMKWYREEYPGLKEYDYRFVCYLMAGFPASTISLLTGLSANNVYVRKNRLLESVRNGSAKHRNLFLITIE